MVWVVAALDDAWPRLSRKKPAASAKTARPDASPTTRKRGVELIPRLSARAGAPLHASRTRTREAIRWVSERVSAGGADPPEWGCCVVAERPIRHGESPTLLDQGGVRRMLARLNREDQPERRPGWFHPDRASGRDHHHRDPARDRNPVVHQVPGSREQVGRAGQRPRVDPGVEAYYADNNTYAGADLTSLQTTYDQGIKNIVVVSATSTTYCIQSNVGAESMEEGRPRCRHRDRHLLNEPDLSYHPKGRESAPFPYSGLKAAARRGRWTALPPISRKRGVQMLARLAKRIDRTQRPGWFHPDRASGRDHHHRDPARDRNPVVHQVPRSREQVGRAGQRPRVDPGSRGVLRRQQHVCRRALTYLQTTYDQGVKNIIVVSAASTTYCIQSTDGAETWKKAGPGADIVSGAC